MSEVFEKAGGAGQLSQFCRGDACSGGLTGEVKTGPGDPVFPHPVKLSACQKA
jgi:hypothetical protein